MRMTHTIGKGVLCVLTAVVATTTVGASSASALSPWWHLSVHPAPTVLQAGKAKDEVQSIEASLEEVGLGTPVVVFEVRVKGNSVGVFATEPAGVLLGGVPEPTATNVQTALEGAYGSGNVEVTGGPAGTSPLLVKSVGADSDATVGTIEIVEFGVGKASAMVVTPAAVDGDVVVTAANLGDANANGAAVPITIADTLPSGVRAATIEGDEDGQGVRPECSLATLSCTFHHGVGSFGEDEVVIGVAVEGAAKSGGFDHASVIGGEASPVNVGAPLSIGETARFGVQAYEITPEEEGGSTDTQAGSHPFQLTTTIMVNQSSEEVPSALTKDLQFKLPAGLIGNPTPFTRCTLAQFYTQVGESLACPEASVVGVSRSFIRSKGSNKSYTAVAPVFNLEPQDGEPARFAFNPGVPILLDTSVRTGGDYGVTVTVLNVPQQVAFLGSELTFWGVPGSPVHDSSRGYACLVRTLDEPRVERKEEEENKLPTCSPYQQTSPPPLLSLPTSCTGQLSSTVEADPWSAEGSFVSSPTTVPLPALDGCNRLPFTSSISVAPDSEAGSSASGLTVGIHVPQEEALNAEGLSPADVRNTTVVLPVGVALNPAAGDGLLACSQAQIALDVDAPPTCPEASKVGTVSISTPLLPNKIEGAVYLAAQDQNPFGSLVALYIVAEDPVSGTLIKVAGEVKLDPVTGQLVSTFDDTPQLPFEDLALHFFGGARAPLGSPALCGTYTTVASIQPWSGNPPSVSSSSFHISSGPNGSPCSDPVPFSPSLTAGATNIQAGAFTPFTMTMSREDGQQNLGAIQLHMPAGLSGLLTGVELCGEAQADAGTCGSNSLIGETTVSVGLGGDPYSVRGGKVYITGPYEGAPFGLSIVVPAKAGPYDLGQVVVRGHIQVDPSTAALTVNTDSTGPYAIPHILDGIPLQIKHVNFTTTRSGFTFNPTDCDPLSITGSLSSVEGSSASLSVPFQVTNCATLAFKPQFSVSTSGSTSRANGASLHVKLTYPTAAFGSQANIKSVKVDLPKQLPSRLTTLQKACTEQQFEANPAGCPAASIVGHAKAITPLIPVPLEGPAYFVSHGGAKFPELIVALQGYGVTLYLHGETFISKAGITSSTFRTIPDAPVGSFELTLPEGSDSALAANGNLCATGRTVLVKKKVRVRSKGRTKTVTRTIRKMVAGMVMPTAFNAQNGMVVHQNTPIEVTGCGRHKAKTTKAKHGRGAKGGRKK